jgi:hypothetical protein
MGYLEQAKHGVLTELQEWYAVSLKHDVWGLVSTAGEKR